MEIARIAKLLEPYLARPAAVLADSNRQEQAGLSAEQLNSISMYIDILVKWNAHMNLTAVREPEEIVRRHFGESLFTARCLFPQPVENQPVRIIDVGSGAGFPGLPIKLWLPQTHVTLIESNNKKATFLREVVRTITLTNIDVFAGRGEGYQGTLGDVVTLRAVEKFEKTLPMARRLVASGGRLALLIGESQYQQARNSEPSLQWNAPQNLPGSLNRVLLVGQVNQAVKESE